MKTSISSAFITSFGKGAVLVAAFAIMSAPALSHAATYAYVQQSGNVSTVEASSWMAAIATAFSISLHSGVLLLDTINETNMVGKKIPGV